MAKISPRFPSGRVDMGENDKEECMVTSIWKIQLSEEEVGGYRLHEMHLLPSDPIM